MLFRLFFMAMMVTGALSCSAAEPQPLKTEEEKTFYALGLAVARQFGPMRLSESEVEFVLRGIRDGTLGRKSEVSLDDYQDKLRTLTQDRAKAAVAAEKADAAAYVEGMAAKEGAVRLDSGMVMQEITAGTGESPIETNTVRVHYHGTLRDGTVFDSSVERGEPATFPLNRVIPCWTQGLQQMKTGGKSRLVCPPDLAYGDRGAGPKIPPGSALVFEVELLEIVPEEEGEASPQ
jgi:FKBP-type peptidyl-prolyl cis-trans isomerase